MEPAAESSRRSQAELAYVFDATGYSPGAAKISLTKKWWWFAQKREVTP